MRRWPLTVRGSGVVLLGASCFVAAGMLGLVLLQMLGVLLLALAVACLVRVYASRPDAEVDRIAIPEAPEVGDDVTVNVVVRLRSNGALPAGRWHDGIPIGLTGEAAGLFPALASAWSRAERSVTLTYPLVAERRGVHWIGPLRVRIADPFGVAARTIELGDTFRMVVAPAPVALRPLGAIAGRAGGAHAAPSNRYGQGADDLVARPWAPGDSMRRIHWRASAHRDELMVRQEERETSPEAVVVLDRAAARYQPTATGAPGSDAAFETAVVACVSAMTRLAHDGFAVTVLDGTGMPLCAPLAPGDEASTAAALAAFAELRAVGATSASGFGGVAAALRTDAYGGPLVLVTGRVEAADAAGLGTLVRRSSLPVLLAIDADPAQLAAVGPWRVGAISAGAPQEPAEVWENLSASPAAMVDTRIAEAWARAMDGVTDAVG